MDNKRLKEIQNRLKNGDMSLAECLSALSEVSAELHKQTGEKKYERVSIASELMAIGEEKGLDEDTNIDMALNYFGD